MGVKRQHGMPRLVFGLALMTFGVLFVLNNFGWVSFGHLFRFWPVILIVLGLSKLLTPYQGWSGVIWLVVGVCALLVNLGIARIHQLWPIVLVLVGAKIVWRGLYPERDAPRACRGAAVAEELGRASEEPADAASPSGNAITLSTVAFLGGVERRVQGCDLRGGSVVAFMGGCEVDLRGAGLALPEVTLDVTAFWGGVELMVPSDWRVEWRGTAFLGGFSDRTQSSSAPSGVLILTGVAMMGGVEIHN